MPLYSQYIVPLCIIQQVFVVDERGANNTKLTSDNIKVSFLILIGEASGLIVTVDNDNTNATITYSLNALNKGNDS